MAEALTGKRRQILECIAESVRDRGYPPSVREIAESVGLSSPSTVHNHLAVLQQEGFLIRDPSKPRAIEVRFDSGSPYAIAPGRLRQVPMVGEVAAGTGVIAAESIEGVMALPEEITGQGTLFMLKVKGDSMIEAGIFDGDFVVVRQQPTADNGDTVVAGIPGDEATVKIYSRRSGQVVLTPANPSLEPMFFDEDQVSIFGRVVTVLRKL